ncbi:MAG: orotidine-5'-phosphate decarboxylase [Candidatus Aadella gelida]|nr:orotidine-5'-phosphate decarboxylase [Candidatus Aadella gelida]
MEARERLIVALDVKNYEHAVDLIEELAPEVDIFKVGIAPFTLFGEAILDKLEYEGKKCFLDLKFHDIPNTVANAARSAMKRRIFMTNFHCLGGRHMLEAATEGIKEKDEGDTPPILLGVTILTSMNASEMNELGFEGNLEEKVLDLAHMAQESGLNGVVASARESKMIKEHLGDDFIVVTPGIRPEWAKQGDQKRILTPKQAIKEKADYIVVGRPIIEADDPAEAARRIIEEIEEGC